MKPQKVELLRKLLIEAEDKFVIEKEMDADAIAPALKYKNPRDQEFAAFVCAVIAYGKVQHIKISVSKLLAPLGESPVEKLLASDSRQLAKMTEGWKHRFNTESDAYYLFRIMKSIYERDTSLENFMTRANNLESVKDLLEEFVIRIELRLKELKLKPAKSFWFFFPRPSSGSACKRLNLYLRWMAGRGHFDLKLWTKPSMKHLMIPLDVHLLNQARSLKMTKRKQADWVTVEEVTSKLRLLDENNPTRFDFALCHLGIKGKILASIAMFFLFVGCQTALVDTATTSAEVPVSEEMTKAPPKPAKAANFTQQDEARFLRAVRDDDIKQVRFFISMGIDVNKNFKFPAQESETALSSAIESRSRNSIRLLLDAGAKPDIWESQEGTELITAILNRQEFVALELVKNGAKPDRALTESKETALMSASRVGMCSVVKALVDKNAKLDMQNEDGYTALMYASEYGHSDCVNYLVEAKAKTNIKNEAGRTAKDLASNKLKSEAKAKL